MSDPQNAGDTEVSILEGQPYLLPAAPFSFLGISLSCTLREQAVPVAGRPTPISLIHGLFLEVGCFAQALSLTPSQGRWHRALSLLQMS